MVRTCSPRRYHRVHYRRDWQHDCVQQPPCAERACFGNRVRDHLWVPRLLRLWQGRDVGFNDATAERTGAETFYRTSADLPVSLAPLPARPNLESVAVLRRCGAGQRGPSVLERPRFEELVLTWQRLAANLEQAMALLDHFDPDKKSG